MVGSDGHDWILGIRIFILEPVTSAAMPLTIMCSHHRRPVEANIFPVTSAIGSTVNFER
jgi:hypothetical protein